MLNKKIRPLKFRIWWKNEMIYDAMVGNGQCIFICEITSDFVWQKLSQCSAMQYVGHVDKHKTEIYEGDIIWYMGRFYVIQQGSGGFDLVRYKLYKGKFVKSLQFSLSIFVKRIETINSVEVVGNIYEHPYLLNNQFSKNNKPMKIQPAGT